ncbi:MAG: GCN5-related N-acetyltransferase [Solirubrobacterales bacterium]|nr:GCN5-related N-acetyltransferase [Solirubrobacterales bacterium]
MWVLLDRRPPAPALHIRDIRADDKQLLAEGLSHLSPASVHARFLAAKPRLTSRELRYLTEVDGRDHVALIAFDTDGDLVAVARYVRHLEDPTTAEVGLVVCDRLQGQGVGTRLGLHLADRARRNGIEHFSAIILPENQAALRLFTRISARLHTAFHDGVRELVGDLLAA